MVCLSCSMPTPGSLCSQCEPTLCRSPDRLLGGVRVIAAFSHEGAARRLVHLLKYAGVVVFAEMAADHLADRIPRLPLVPIPRAVSRRLRYGVDPAVEIARAVARRTGQPVVPVLAPRLHARRRAGEHHRRPHARFALRANSPPEVILVDDVVTTGATIVEAVASIGAGRVRLAAVANSTAKVSSLPDS